MMTCLPQSGGCERPFTDAFVDHLNSTEGAQYVHCACLDVVDRQHPQPEALYVDSERNVQLVIERKSISSPADYAQRHSNDHFVSDLFEKALKDLPLDDLYEVSLPMLVSGPRSKLKLFVQGAVQSIRSHWPRIVEGSVLRSSPGRELWWSVRRVPGWDRLDGAPNKGWQFNFSDPPTNRPDYIDATNLPRQVTSALQKIYSSCTRKFALYPSARRVLVLDPYEDLRYQSADWWHDVFSAFPPPARVDEVWLGIFDWISEDLQGWIFERIH
jgi:hypothetical protein